MRNKIIYISIFLMFISLKSMSQDEVLSKQEAISLKENVIKKSEQTTSIINDFVQSKHLSFLSKDIISQGKLVFKAPDLIKWEYKTPYIYSVIFKEDQLFINDDGTKSNIDLNANKAFKELNALIIKSVKGDMFDESQFKIDYYKLGQDYLVSFTSLDKSLKLFIHKFELTFDGKNFNVLEIKMIESSEDYTSIKFLNQKINEPVSDAIFIN